MFVLSWEGREMKRVSLSRSIFVLTLILIRLYRIYRTKTTLLTSRHYIDYVRTQLGGSGDEASKLVEIDFRFDPYSDTAISDISDEDDAINLETLYRLCSYSAGRVGR